MAMTHPSADNPGLRVRPAVAQFVSLAEDSF
jgi:hypothetical protein